MMQNNHIKNCDVTVRYIDVAQDIWGNYIDALKGKSNRTKPNSVAGGMIKIPKDLLKIKKKVFLVVDLFFVNGVPFLSCSVARLTSQE